MKMIASTDEQGRSPYCDWCKVTIQTGEPVWLPKRPPSGPFPGRDLRYYCCEDHMEKATSAMDSLPESDP